MTVGQLGRMRAIPPFALAAIVAMAFLTRLDFLVLRGGLAADQLAWASQNYYGGITSVYLGIRDAILSWTPEPQPWPYLPGYGAFLAILYDVGARDLAHVRLAQAAIDALAILPLYFVLHRIGNSAVLALVGCLLYAIAPWWSMGSTYLLSESLAPALMIVLLAAMLLIRDRQSGPAYWFLLGLLGAILPFFRSEMMLLFGPLAIWALLVARERRRVASAVCVVAGFALPLLLWGARNYYIHGQLVLLPPAKWYNAWSGLGQIANDFGYIVSDDRASRLLATKGIRYQSLEAENYWFREYLAAWTNHPGHVLRTIFYRIKVILGRPETLDFVPRFAFAAYQAMALITAIALVWLLNRRRWSDAFLIALPMFYALGTLGPLYVEPRYVRYAGLSYLLVLPIVLGKGIDLVLKLRPRGWRSPELQHPKEVLGTLILAVVAAGAVVQLVSTTTAARSQGLIDRLELGSSQSPTATLEEMDFQSAAPGIEVSRGEGGLHLLAHVPAGAYLTMVPMGVQADGAAIIGYRVMLQRGAIGFGVLTADTHRWLAHVTASGVAGETIEGTFVSVVEPGSHFVIDAQAADGEVAAVANKLEWALVCPRQAGLFSLVFSEAKVPASKCSPRPAPN